MVNSCEFSHGGAAERPATRNCDNKLARNKQQLLVLWFGNFLMGTLFPPQQQDPIWPNEKQTSDEDFLRVFVWIICHLESSSQLNSQLKLSPASQTHKLTALSNLFSKTRNKHFNSQKRNSRANCLGLPSISHKFTLNSQESASRLVVIPKHNIRGNSWHNIRLVFPLSRSTIPQIFCTFCSLFLVIPFDSFAAAQEKLRDVVHPTRMIVHC